MGFKYLKGYGILDLRSILHVKCRVILGLAFAPVVEAWRGPDVAAAAKERAGYAPQERADVQTPDSMKKFKILIAESAAPEDFYAEDCEGHVVQAMARVLHWKATYKIALNAKTLCRAIRAASSGAYDILHLSCHGDEEGIQLTDEAELSWEELADCFQEIEQIPRALVISSCLGGDNGIARAFQDRKRRPSVIFGAEGKRNRRITFRGACITWPILYTSLAKIGLTPEAFKDAISKMNLITKHQFVYRRWDEGKYRRYPSRKEA
jgi:hypothetical protein